MPDELERKLGVIGAEVAKLVMWPTGCSIDNFNFAVSQHNHSLLFEHGDLKVEVSGFKLVDAEHWSEDDRHHLQPAVYPSGLGALWYSANISWQVGKQKGGADDVVLGYGADRDRALRGLAPNTPARVAVNDLLVAVEQVASRIYEGDLLESQLVNRVRKFAEDVVSRIKEF